MKRVFILLRPKVLLVATLYLILSGCGSHPSLPDRNSRTDTLRRIVGSDSETLVLATKPFALYAVAKKSMQCRGKRIYLYIEGDGMGWLTRHTPSSDPTPTNPLAARLYRADPHPCKAYLARPCQYLGTKGCSVKDWTDARFSSRVVSSYLGALDRLKRRYGNRGFVLIGYSGGGAVAALIAARRGDISRLVTVAGNLDTRAWSTLHRTSPLSGSLNPVDFSGSLGSTPQTHLVGGSDRNVPKSIYDAYRSHFAADVPIRAVVYPGYSHASHWENIWRDFITKETHGQ